MSSGLTDPQRETLDRLADVLAPAYERMPAASAIGISGAMLETVLNFRPDLRPELVDLLRDADGQDPEPWVRQLAEHDPVRFRTLGAVVAHGYYLNADVRWAIGYPGQERLPFDADALPEYVSNGMMQRVIDRGPIWRDARHSGRNDEA